MSLNFRDLEYFLTLAEHGHMGRTAALHGVTQPALSKALQRLEGQVGLTLFDRTGRMMQLNASGLVFLEHAKTLHAHYQDALRHTSALQAGQAGLLRIGATPATLDSIVMPALTWLMPRRPALKVSLSVGLSDSLCDDVVDGLLDLLVIPMYSEEYPLLHRDVLTEDELVIVVRQGHDLLAKRGLKLADTLDYQWVLPHRNSSARRRLLRRFHELALPEPRAAMEVSSISPGILDVVSQTDFISFAPMSLLSKSGDKRVQQLPLRVPTLRQLCLVARHEATWTPLMDAFREALGMSRSA